MIKKRLKILLKLSVLLLFISCSGDESNKNNSDFYSNDKSLLGLEIVDKDIGIHFFPPKDWILMPASLSKKIETRNGMLKSPDNFIYQPIYLFFNDSTSGVLSIGKVIPIDSSTSQNSKLNYYKSILSSKYKNRELSIGNFKKSNISFTQFKFKKENLLSLKMVFENSRSEIIQIEYSLPEKHFVSAEASIKSSVGSISLE